MKSTIKFCFCVLAIFVAASICSCSISREVIIMSKPQSASIYIDGEYQGNGYVKYTAPKGVKSIQVSCSTDGYPYDSKVVYLSGKKQYVSVSIEEFMKYGSQQTTIRNH